MKNDNDNLEEVENISSDKDISLLDVDNKLIKKTKMKNCLIVFLMLVFFIGSIYLLIPKIKLKGDSEIIISYKDNYTELGYNCYSLNKDITKLVDVYGDVKSGVIGEYTIEYLVKWFGIKFKKYRKVSIVDLDKPVITVKNEIMEICPNQDITDIEYSAVDEYEGDISSRVEKEIFDNEILLSVSDNSDNMSSLKIKIERKDTTKPEIKLKGGSVVYLNYGSRYVEAGYNAYDNCDGDLSSLVNVSGNVERKIGVYVIEYSVSDKEGNSDKVSRTVIVRGEIKNNGTINNGTIYLTFDDGPNQGTTNKILDILKEENVPATFFVVNKGSDSLLKRIHDEGHTIGLHTASHEYSYIYSSVNNFYSDLKKISDRVKAVTGLESKIIRFPGGSSNTISRDFRLGIMTELTSKLVDDGYRYYDWNIDCMDASSARNGDDVFYNVVGNLRKNRANMVLMHDTKNMTVSAIRDIIKYGKDNGYEFKKIDMNTYMVRHSVNN